MAVVTFDPAAFIVVYPEFTSVDPARATSMFTIAEQSLLDNTANSPVMDPNYRLQLFYMLVAHLLLIFGVATPTAPNNAPPGRLSSATEGTVTSQFEYNLPQGSNMAAWYVQTKYGAMFWTATAMFRSMLYMMNGSSGIGYAKAYGVAPVNIPGGV